MSPPSVQAKEILIEFATLHGVRREDIIRYAERVRGRVLQDSLIEKAKRVEEFEKSESKENSLQAYRDAIQVFGTLYAGCDSLSAIEELEGGYIYSDSFTILGSLSIAAFTLYFIATFLGKIAIKTGKGIIIDVSKAAIEAARGAVADAIVPAFERTSTNLGTQAIAWTGIVTALIILPVTIAAVAILRR